VAGEDLEAEEAAAAKTAAAKASLLQEDDDEIPDFALLQFHTFLDSDAEGLTASLLDADKKKGPKHTKHHAKEALAESKKTVESLDADIDTDSKAATLVDEMATAFMSLDEDMEVSLDELEEEFTNRSAVYASKEEKIAQKQAELVESKAAAKELHSRLQVAVNHLSEGIVMLQEQIKSLRTFLTRVGGVKKDTAKTHEASHFKAAPHKASLFKKAAEKNHEAGAPDIITFAGEKKSDIKIKHKATSLTQDTLRSLKHSASHHKVLAKKPSAKKGHATNAKHHKQ